MEKKDDSERTAENAGLRTGAVSELVPYDNNPRVISPAAVDACAESIKQCSALDPIEVDENNVILSRSHPAPCVDAAQCGHGRRGAATPGLTEEQKQKYRLLANKTGEMTGWDFSKLEQELLEVDFGGFDFDFDIPQDDDAGVSYIDSLMEDGFTKASEKKEFSVTFTFPVECEEEIKGYISENTKEPLEKAILNRIRGVTEDEDA